MMYIAKFLVVKTVGLPSSTAVLSQVQWCSVWLRVKCVLVAFEGPQQLLQKHMEETA